jgi:hypothetical protein
VFSPSCDERAVFREFHDAIIGLMALDNAVAVGDEDVAVRRGDHIRGRIEHPWRVAGLTRLAQCQQDLALRRELDDGMTFPVFTAPICDPHIAGPIDIEAVRPIGETAAEIRNHFPAGVYFHHRIDRRTGAAVAAATLEDPQCLPVAMVDFHPDRSAELAITGQLQRQLLHTIRIRCGIWIVCALGIQRAVSTPDHNRG